jgi:hypothetical protein
MVSQRFGNMSRVGDQAGAGAGEYQTLQAASSRIVEVPGVVLRVYQAGHTGQPRGQAAVNQRPYVMSMDHIRPEIA